MNLSEKQIDELKELAKKHDVVNHVLEEYEKDKKDVAMTYFTALNKAVETLSETIGNKTLSKKDEFTEALIDLLSKSKPIGEALRMAYDYINKKDEADLPPLESSGQIPIKRK